MQISLDKIVKRIYFILASKYETELLEPYSFFYKRVVSRIKKEPKLVDTIKESILKNYFVTFDGEFFEVKYGKESGQIEEFLVSDDLASVFELEYMEVLKRQEFIQKYDIGNQKRYLDEVDLNILLDLCDNNEQVKLIQILLDMYYFQNHFVEFNGDETFNQVIKSIIMLDGDEEILKINDRAYDYVDRILQLKYKDDENEVFLAKFADVKKIYSKLKKEFEI